jgi:predicted phosphodiesterase
MNIENKVLIIPDVHIPYHTKSAFDLMLKAGSDYKPDTIVILGDFIDNYSISKYSKAPQREKFLKWEVAEANKALDRIDVSFPLSTKVFLAGNHEERLERYISDKAPELFGLVDTNKLLKLWTRGYTYYPYGGNHRIGKLYFTHGDIIRENVTAAMLDKYEKSICFGHTHRMEQTIKVNVLGEGHLGTTCGWLGDINKTDYIKTFSNWQLGFATAVVLSNGNFFTQLHPIVSNKCWINGKIYNG